MKEHACYLLRKIGAKATYIGYTNDFGHRIRCHQMKIKGGAKATHAWKGKAEWVAVISGFATSKAGLQFEWAWKHMGNKGVTTNTRSKTEPGRIRRLYQLLMQRTWTKKSDLAKDCPPLSIKWNKRVKWRVGGYEGPFRMPVTLRPMRKST